VPVEADASVETDARASRWSLIREVFIFQIKLTADGMKDFVLGPLALAAGLLDLARATPPDQGWFYKILRSGARFDRWVGLFDAVERPKPAPERSLPAAPEAPAPSSEPSLETHLDQLERILVERHRRGGLTAEAKRSVDRVLDLMASSHQPAAKAPRAPTTAPQQIVPPVHERDAGPGG